MNPASPKPEGSTQAGNLDEGLVAECLAGEAGAIHWASGMPLSYVHEMASHRLSLYDQTTRQIAPVVSESTHDASPQAGED
ncbi:MAG TPA: hypothetical protein VE178_21205 [Silvibacterium sp.]|nr:hypothetical protein [Silvibacterium sp.]